jgi:hypothetical protein
MNCTRERDRSFADYSTVLTPDKVIVCETTLDEAGLLVVTRLVFGGNAHHCEVQLGRLQ